jgi:hypothetical protein
MPNCTPPGSKAAAVNFSFDGDYFWRQNRIGPLFLTAQKLARAKELPRACQPEG